MRKVRSRKPKAAAAATAAEATAPDDDKNGKDKATAPAPEGFEGTTAGLLSQVFVLMLILAFGALGAYLVFNPQAVMFLEPVLFKGAPISSLWETGQPSHPDVVQLTSLNFAETIETEKHVLVDFYAPWCGHCKKLSAPYGEAAAALKGEVVLAAVDGTVHKDLANEYDVKAYPTVIFFSGGQHETFSGGKTKKGIVNWVGKRVHGAVVDRSSEGAVSNFKATVQAQAQEGATEAETAVVGIFGPDHGFLAEAFKARALEDNDRAYASADPSLAVMFGAQAPSVVLLTSFAPGQAVLDLAEHAGAADGRGLGPIKDAYAAFIGVEKNPVVMEFTSDRVQEILKPAQNRTALLFGASEELREAYAALATQKRSEFLFTHVGTANEDTRLRTYVGGGKGGGKDPVFVIFVPGTRTKYPMAAKLQGLAVEAQASAIAAHVDSFLAGSLAPYYKSADVPASNDEPVKVVVGKTFNSLVMDDTVVFLEVYAPWCGHCKKLAPIWDQLAKHYADNKDVRIAKMDGTDNEAAEVSITGFPTLLLFGKGATEAEKYTGERNLDGFVTYIDSQLIRAATAKFTDKAA